MRTFLSLTISLSQVFCSAPLTAFSLFHCGVHGSPIGQAVCASNRSGRENLIFLYAVLWSRHLYLVIELPNFLSWHKHRQQLSLERTMRKDVPFCIQHFFGRKFICITRLINWSVQAQVCVHSL